MPIVDHLKSPDLNIFLTNLSYSTGKAPEIDMKMLNLSDIEISSFDAKGKVPNCLTFDGNDCSNKNLSFENMTASKLRHELSQEST